jgi:FkbM family methyltransferase
MIIQTNSRRLAVAARLSRLFPPGCSGVFLRLFPNEREQQRGINYVARSSLAAFTMKCNRMDWVSKVFAIRGFFDWGISVIANSICEAGDTIIEVGANIGTESLFFSRVVGPTGKVHCFEPLPDNVRILQEQIALNGISNIQLHQAAVGKQTGQTRFRIPSETMNFGEGHIAHEGLPADVTTIEVEVVTLDSLFEQGSIRSPRLVCMDVQGHEPFVLRGAVRLLSECRPIVILEIEPQFLLDNGQSPASILEQMQSLDYRCWSISKWGLQPAQGNRPEICNWIAISNKHGDAEKTAKRLSRQIKRAAAMPLIRGLNPAVI